MNLLIPNKLRIAWLHDSWLKPCSRSADERTLSWVDLNRLKYCTINISGYFFIKNSLSIFYILIKIALNIIGKPDALVTWDGLLDMSEQDVLKEDCIQQAGKKEILCFSEREIILKRIFISGARHFHHFRFLTVFCVFYGAQILQHIVQDKFL